MALLLRRIRPDRNERRFYRMEVTLDLFGCVVLLRSWGRIGGDGRERQEVFPDRESAAGALGRRAAAKRRRGYVAAPVSQ